MTSQRPEITWKRMINGQYVARYGYWVYTVFRSDLQPRGRQWILEAYPEANPDATQQRTGFSNSQVAKEAATHSPCFICGRRLPFGTLEPHHRDSRRKLVGTWRCREREQCLAERDRITASSRALTLEFRNTDKDDILIRDDADGLPQMVFVEGHNRNVVDLTENDLDLISQRLHDRSIARLRKAAGHEVAEG